MVGQELSEGEELCPPQSKWHGLCWQSQDGLSPGLLVGALRGGVGQR